MVGSKRSDWKGDVVYEFRVRGELGSDWSEWFDQFEVIAAAGETLIRGPIRDQSGLYGVIAKLRNLGLTLISLNGGPAASG